MFASEVRFYLEVAPVVGVRVPTCFAAEASPNGTRLVLEDLSTWSHFADPRAVAAELARLHRRWKVTRRSAGPGSGDPAWVPI